VAFIRSVIRGVGAHLPKRVMTNDDLSRLVDTTDAWIRERTGIEERHIAEEGELTSDLGIAASRRALVRAGIDPVDIDLVVCATSTPDRTFPATGVRIQAGLGITRGAAFDVQAVCSGFIYALSIADNFLKTGQFKRAVVVGAETFSRILDWSDRGTCVLFGDGAGAVVLGAQTQRGSREHLLQVPIDAPRGRILDANGQVLVTNVSFDRVYAVPPDVKDAAGTAGRLAPVLGRWMTLTAYLNEVQAGDYTPAASADEFRGDPQFPVPLLPISQVPGAVSHHPQRCPGADGTGQAHRRATRSPQYGRPRHRRRAPGPATRRFGALRPGRRRSERSGWE